MVRERNSAMRFLIRRIGFYLIAAWASITLNFFLPRAMPGDPASVIFASFRGQLRPEQLKSLKEAYGFVEGPLWKQYLTYLGQIASLNFGISISSFPAKVTTVISTGLAWTLLLGAVTLVIGFLLGNFLGVLAAWKRGGWVDTVLPPLTIFVGSFPYFWLAMLLLFLLGFKMGVFPMGHAYADNLAPQLSMKFIWSVIYHMILPAFTIIIVSIGGWLLGMRNTMISVLGEDYVAMAEAKGLPQRRVMLNYAARNALLPSVTSFGMALGFVVSGQIVTEIVFSYPGVDYQLYRAVQNLDYPLMQALFLMITLAVLVANLLVDILYVRLDPRVRVS